MQLVETVVNNAKFHLLQEETSQFIVANVFRSINHKTEEVPVAADLAAEEVLVAADLAAEEVLVAADLAAEEVLDLTEGREKCTKQLVETVARNAKFHSSQNRTSQFIAMNALKAIREADKQKYGR